MSESHPAAQPEDPKEKKVVVVEKKVEEKDAKEKEAKEKEAKEKEVKEKEAKEKEVKEKEAKEKEVKENEVKEKDAKKKDAKEKEVKEKEAKAKEAKEKTANEKEVKVEEKEAKEKEVKEKESKEKAEKSTKKEAEAEKKVEEKQAKVQEKEAKEQNAKEKKEVDQEQKEKAHTEKEAAEDDAAAKSGKEKKEAKKAVKFKGQEEKAAAKAEAKDEKEENQAAKDKHGAVTEVQKAEVTKEKQEAKDEDAKTSRPTDFALSEQETKASGSGTTPTSDQGAKVKAPIVVERDFALSPTASPMAEAQPVPSTASAPAPTPAPALTPAPNPATISMITPTPDPASASAPAAAVVPSVLTIVDAPPVPVQDDVKPVARAWTTQSGQVVTVAENPGPTSPPPKPVFPPSVVEPVEERKENVVEISPSPAVPLVRAEEPKVKNVVVPTSPISPSPAVPPIRAEVSKERAVVEPTKPTPLPSPAPEVIKPKVVQFRDLAPSNTAVEDDDIASPYPEPIVLSEIKKGEVIQDKRLPDGTIIEDRRIIKDVVKSDGTNILQETEITTIDPEMHPVSPVNLPKEPQPQSLPTLVPEAGLTHSTIARDEVFLIATPRRRVPWVHGQDWEIRDRSKEQEAYLFESNPFGAESSKVIKNMKGEILGSWSRHHLVRRWKLIMGQDCRVHMRTSYSVGRARRDIRVKYKTVENGQAHFYLHGHYAEQGGLKVSSGRNASGSIVMEIKPKAHGAVSTSSASKASKKSDLPYSYEIRVAKGFDIVAACAICIAQDQSRTNREKRFRAVSNLSPGLWSRSTETLSNSSFVYTNQYKSL